MSSSETTVNFPLQEINEAYLPYKESPERYQMYYGGAGSGKSHFVAQKLLLACMRDNYFRCVYGRKVARTIRDSNFKLLTDLIKEYDLQELFTVNRSEMDIRCENGNEFISFGMDNPEKVKSIVDPSHIWAEELTEYSQEDFEQLDLRLRTPKVKHHQFIGSFNPIDQEHWIKTNLFDDPPNDTLILKTTYKDNQFIDPNYEEKLNRLKKTSPSRYRVYALGEWGVMEVQSPYMNAFDERLNVSRQAIFQPQLQVRASFDFNVDNCVCVLSHAGTDFIHFFDELIGDNLPDLLTKVKRKYGAFLASFIITGDRSGKSRHHMIGDNMNSFRMIKNTLNIREGQFKVINNPTHAENRFTCNTILAYHPNVFFNPDFCKETIFDMMYVECDQDQKIIKKDRNVSNQKADLLDGVRYSLNTFHKDFVHKYQFKKIA